MLPDAEVRFVWHEPGPIAADSGVLVVGATHSFDETPSPDVILVPGGFTTMEHARDEKVLDWLRRAHETATWTASVCSGSVILAAAGLLEGKRATSHWAALSALKALGVKPVGDERIVSAEGSAENKIVTCAGVSAGIDLGLWLAGQIGGEGRAKAIQLSMEYDPQPPFDSGHMSKASASTKATATALMSKDLVKPKQLQATTMLALGPRDRAGPREAPQGTCSRSVGGVNLAYDDRGSGDPVLFIAGRGGAGRTWHLHQVPAFLAAGYRAITFDNRGIGATEQADGFGIEQMVADTAALIEKLDAAPARIVAVSMGSFIAQELMLARPELVRSAVLMATRGRHDRTRDFFRTAERELADAGVELPRRLRRENPAAGELLAEDAQRRRRGARLDRHVHHVADQADARAARSARRRPPRATGCPLTEVLRRRCWSSGSPTTSCCRRTWAARSPTPCRTAATWRFPTPATWASSRSRRSSTRRRWNSSPHRL